MAFVKKTWKDRLSEFPGRRTLKRVSGSADSTMIVDVTRNEGAVSQAGDAFSATNMNDLESRIANGFSTTVDTSKILDSKEAVAANTKSGRIAGALALKEVNDRLNSLLKWKLLKTMVGNSDQDAADLSSLDYEELLLISHYQADNNVYTGSCVICKDFLKLGTKYYHSGSLEVEFRWLVTPSSAKLARAMYKTASNYVELSTTTYVYYR